MTISAFILVFLFPRLDTTPGGVKEVNSQAKDNAKIELRHSRHKRRLVCSASTGLCWSQSMKPSINRREFLKRSTVISAGLATLTSVPSSRAGADANNKIIVAVMGTNGRGMDHIQAYLGQPNVEIAYICDVDSRAVEKGLAAVVKKQEKQPKGIKDFREALEDKSVDVLSIAAPNHWHAPATILACAAGKHVYVEKPCCHNPREGELMVAAARKHKRVVQMGNQRRSWPWVIEAIEKVRGGEIGRVTFARTWDNNARGTICRGKPAAVPSWLDYSLWQGAA